MFRLSRKILLICSILVLSTAILFAEESITITTYYPSPYGTYHKLATNKLAVGYLSNDDQPTFEGDIRLKPHTTPLDLEVETGKPGEIALNSDGNIYIHNGATWTKQSGGGGCYVSYGNNPVNNQTCLDGFTNKGNLGKWGRCTAASSSPETGSSSGIFRPPAGECTTGYATDKFTWVIDINDAYLCCQ